MNNNVLEGKIVRLTAPNADKDAEIMARWSRDSEYGRLLDTDPATPRTTKQSKEGIEQWMEREQPDSFQFMIRTLADDRLIGFVGLRHVSLNNRDGWVGIGIGDRNDWGKGYGTDAMCIILRFAFAELNLHRVSLCVFAYNPRAIRSYEKAGFKIEGCERQYIQRNGERYDVINMGVLREEWEIAQEK